MTSLLASRRRAEDFARLVEGSRRASDDPDLAPLLGLVTRLRPADVRPSDDFRRSLRAQLVAVAAERAESGGGADVLEAPVTGTTARTPARLRVGAMAASIVLAGGMVGTAAAARSALPGDLLYPLKRSLERTEALVTTNAESRGLEYLAQASTRLTELSELTADGRIYSDDTARVDLSVSTLQEFTRHSRDGGALLVEAFRSDHRSSPLLRLREFIADAKPRLEATAAFLPTEANGAYTEALTTLERLDAQALQLCPLCDPGVGGVDDADVLSKGSGEDTTGRSDDGRGGASHDDAPSRTDTTSTSDSGSDADDAPGTGSETGPPDRPWPIPSPTAPGPTAPPRTPGPTLEPRFPWPWPTPYPRPTTTTEPEPTPTEEDSTGPLPLPTVLPLPLPTSLPLPLPLPTVLRLPIPLPWFSDDKQAPPAPAPGPMPTVTPTSPTPSTPPHDPTSATSTPGSPDPLPTGLPDDGWPSPTPVPTKDGPFDDILGPQN